MKKQKSILQKFILSAVFALAIFGGFGLGKEKYAQAQVTPTGSCYGFYNYCPPGSDICTKTTEELGENMTEADCTKKCQEFSESHGGAQCNWRNNENKIGQKGKTVAGKSSDICDISDWFSSNFLKCVLLSILAFVTVIMQAAAALFEMVIDPNDVATVINQQAIYEIWKLVRDTLNVSFILVLLFTAFGIVFQVDKFSNKKIILTVILMALLVNFSFPISRFIIDFSNIIMTYFLNSLSFAESGGDAKGFFGQLTNETTLNNILYPGDISTTTHSYLISAIVFSFVFAITLLVIAVLLLVRIVVLTLLVIFSPLAFVGTIVPFFSKQAGQWWDNLFKYSFFGPIMVFMLYVSMKMLVAMQQFGGTLYKSAQNQSADPNNIASVAFFIIPIVILWIGLGFAQSMSIFGAGAVTGRAQKFMKWAGSGVYKAPWWGMKQTGVPGGVQQKYVHWKKGGFFGSEAKEEREARMAGRLGVPKVVEQLDVKKTKEAKEKHDMENMLPNQLRNIAMTGNKYERAAALLELANKGTLDASDKDKNAYEQMVKEMGETSQVFYQLNNKLKGYDPVAAFSHITDPETWKETMEAHVNSNQFDAKKLSGGSLANAEFMKLMFQNQAISNTDLDDLRKKSIGHEKNIKSSLGEIAGDFSNLSETDEKLKKINTNVQMAYFAQSGKLHSSIEGNPDYHEHMFSRLSKDNLKRISEESAERYADDIAAHMNIGKYKEALPNIENRNAQRTLNRRIMSSSDPRAQAMRQAVENDPRLSNIR